MNRHAKKLTELLDAKDAANEKITAHVRRAFPVGTEIDFVHDRGIRRTGRVLYEGSHWGISVENVATGKRRKIDLSCICLD